MREIGSEFHLNSCHQGINEYVTLMSGQREFVLSGRTGLGYIAEDLIRRHRILSVALPAYCCGSMVEPFASKQIAVHFYGQENFQSVAENSDAVLLMDYFGFENPQTLHQALFCRERKIPLIVDATQTAFSRFETYKLCDYLVCSYRKWTDSLCAAVYCREGFAVPFSTVQAPEYVWQWRQASWKKADYLQNGTGEKQDFLNQYGCANHILAQKHDRLAAAKEEIRNLENISSDFLRQRRRENAKFLIDKIPKELDGTVKLMFSRLQQEDCPLFLPIVLPEEKREEIRNRLIQMQIYCPVHWPIDRNYPYLETTLHREEMSLICDQRYDLEDMQRQIKVLKQAIYGDE